MISPIGTDFQTLPVAFLEELVYLSGQSSESVWDGALDVVEEDGENYWEPAWDDEVGPTLHGDGRLWWAFHWPLDSLRMVVADKGSIDPETGAGQFHDYTYSVDLASPTAGMDELLIYRPSDLFVRKPVEAPEVFGNRWERSEESFAVIANTGFMFEGGTHRAFIFALEQDPPYSSVKAGYHSTPIPLLSEGP